MTQQQNVELFLLIHPEREGILLQVWNDVNLPNNPDTDQLVDEFLIENYGGSSKWDYHRISDMDLMFAGKEPYEQFLEIKTLMRAEKAEVTTANLLLLERANETEQKLEAQLIRADKAEQERDKLIQVLKDIVAVPVAKSMHNEALILHNIAHKALEGSNTDAKRD
ncbi:hypothetical protein [Paenibacillus nuruki]|uniref:hypothetical protein n=1 Tax=Paenibacillus nuruki TaxID=1886670 RepID=UPI0028040174|nr:hypothetical protein [Paenibacillus nuruki]CAJ1315942.1 hypothetical protein AASFL403_12020 [Paenibacillus nuruki]